MTEPSYEELKARVAKLEKQAGRRQKGGLEFKVGEKGRRCVRPRSFFHAIEHQAPHDARIFLSSQVGGGRKYMLGIRATYAWAEVLQWGGWLFAG